MLNRVICVIGGCAYTDIDVLACAAAYKQLLTLGGQEACALATGTWNQTIPPSVREWTIDVCREFVPKHANYAYVLVDVSDPLHIGKFVDIDHVVEVFDHHAGFEGFWSQRIQSASSIETVGACATLIWEKYLQRQLHSQISPVNASLLYTAIVANTLNFTAYTTKDRDKKAAEQILPFTNLPENWVQTYYKEIESGFKEQLLENLLNDTKTLTVREHSVFFAQIEMWNASSILLRNGESLTCILPKMDRHWIVNCVSIEEGRCYLFCTDPSLLRLLQHICSGSIWTHECIVTSRPWLRKEFLQQLLLR